MQPRPRQAQFIDAGLSCLSQDGRGLGVAPTGAGKTICMSHIAKPYPRTLFIQHSETLLKQNRNAYRKINPGRKTTTITASRKRFPDGDCAVFGMVLSLANLIDSIPSFDLVVSDESHRAAGKNWTRVIDRLKECNPGIHVLGVTATPERSDRKSLAETFNSIFDIITIEELIQSGHLVPPRCFVIDIGLQGSSIKIGDADAAEALMDCKPVTEKIVQEWEKNSKDRLTVVFGSTQAHCEHLAEAFQAAGHNFACIHSGMPKKEVNATLKKFEDGKIQGLVNPAMLTEGWDCQPVSCVVLCREFSHKSVMTQMVGRGLRKVDPSLFPGIVKTDCHVLDFGRSILTHGDLTPDTRLAPVSRTRRISCRKCGTAMPVGVRTCPVCGAELPVEARTPTDKTKDDLVEFQLTEFALCEQSPFRWEKFYKGDHNFLTACSGFTADACILLEDGIYHTFGRQEGERLLYLLKTKDKCQALATADDFMRAYGDKSGARKTKTWLTQAATSGQRSYLDKLKVPYGLFLTRYQASCLIFFGKNKKPLQQYVYR